MKHLPDPAFAPQRVLRIPLEAREPIRDADHPAGEFESHEKPYVEFEVVLWKNIKGISSPRWVLRGLVAM